MTNSSNNINRENIFPAYYFEDLNSVESNFTERHNPSIFVEKLRDSADLESFVAKIWIKDYSYQFEDKYRVTSERDRGSVLILKNENDGIAFGKGDFYRFTSKRCNVNGIYEFDLKKFRHTAESPKNFKEKAYDLLNHLYMKGGGDYHKFDLDSSKDYILINGNRDEFKRIINFLEDENFLKVKRIPTKDTDFFEVTMTSKSIKLIEKKEGNYFNEMLYDILSKDKIEIAIKLFQDSLTDSSIKIELIHLSGRLNRINKDKRLGIINDDYYNLQRNKILSSLLEIIENNDVNN